MRTKFSAIYRTAQTILLTLVVLMSITTGFVSCSDGMEDVPSTVTPVDPKPDPDPEPDPSLKLSDSDLKLNYQEEPALYHAVAADSLITTVRLMHMDGEKVVLDTVYKKNPWFNVDVQAKESKEILVNSLSALKVTSPLALTASDPTVANIDGYYDRKIVYTGTFTIGTDDGEKSQYQVSIDNEDFSKFFSSEQAVLQLSHAPFVAGDVVVLGENTDMKRDSVTVDGKKYYLVPMSLVFKSYRNKVDASTAKTGTKSAQAFLMEQGRSTATATTKSTRSSVIADYVHDANFTAIVKVAAENGGITPDPEEELLNYNNVRSSYVILPNASNITGKVRSTTILNTQWRVAADRDSTFTMLENYSGSQPADIRIVLGVGKSASLTEKNRSSYPSNTENGNRTSHQLKNWYTFKVDGTTYEGDYYFNWVSGYFTIVTAANKPNGDKIWFKTPTATMVDNATYETVSSNVDVTVDGKNYKRTTYKEVVKVVFGGENGTENITMGRNIVIDVLQESTPDPDPTNKIVRRTFKKEVHELEKANKRVKSYAIYEIEREDGSVKDTIPHAAVYTSYSMIAPGLQEFIQNAHGFSYVSIANNDAKTGLAHALTTTYTFKLNDGTTFTTPFILNYSDAGTVKVFAGTEWELEYTFNPTPASQKWNGTVDGSVSSVGDYKVQGFTVNNLVSLANGTDNNSCQVNTKVEDIINPEKGRLVRHIQRTLSSCNQVASKLWVIDIFEWENGFDIYGDGEFQKYWKKSELDPAMISLFHTATSRGPNGTLFPAVISVHSASNEGYWKYAGKDVNGTEYLSTFAYKAYKYASDAWSVKGITSEFVGDNLVVKQNGTVVLTVSRR